MTAKIGNLERFQRIITPLPRSARFLFVSFLLLVPITPVADVVIKLKNGKEVVLPFEEKEVERIFYRGVNTEQSEGQTADQQSEGTVTPSSALPEQVIWQVGPGRALKYPSEAARKAKNGDIVEIDAGTYRNNYVKWKQNDLTIRGVGGMAHMTSKGLIPNGKAIWIIKGHNTTIENVEFSGAAVKHTNGAGIRLDGGDLTLQDTFFHDNEFSILTGSAKDASLKIISSRFWFQKRKNTYSHGMYIGALKRFTLIGSHIKGTDRGNQVKSRALENHILYNRIEDIPGGNSSRLLDLSNCGLSFVIGNDLHQAASTENVNAIGYGPEKCEQRSEQQKKLYVVNNTFVNEARNGNLVKNHAGGTVLVANNLLFGRGKFLVGDGIERHNVKVDLSERQAASWAMPPGSAAKEAAEKLSDAEGVSLVPTREFSTPAGTSPRIVSGSLDIGSREDSS